MEYGSLVLLEIVTATHIFPFQVFCSLIEIHICYVCASKKRARPNMGNCCRKDNCGKSCTAIERHRLNRFQPVIFFYKCQRRQIHTIRKSRFLNGFQMRVVIRESGSKRSQTGLRKGTFPDCFHVITELYLSHIPQPTKGIISNGCDFVTHFDSGYQFSIAVQMPRIVVVGVACGVHFHR